MAYLFIALTIALTVYGQLVLKWRVGIFMASTPPPYTIPQGALLLLNPWVISAFAAAFGASLFWMAAISKLPISKAYPFMALNFVFVMALAAILFNENLNHYKLAGTAIIVLGVLVLSRSPA